MSDYLIINGESLEVEKKFDKCVVEGFGNTTEDISTNTIIVPVGDIPGPTPEEFSANLDFYCVSKTFPTTQLFTYSGLYLIVFTQYYGTNASVTFDTQIETIYDEKFGENAQGECDARVIVANINAGTHMTFSRDSYRREMSIHAIHFTGTDVNTNLIQFDSCSDNDQALVQTSNQDYAYFYLSAAYSALRGAQPYTNGDHTDLTDFPSYIGDYEGYSNGTRIILNIATIDGTFGIYSASPYGDGLGVSLLIPLTITQPSPSITIEPLSVTSNGIYQEEGKAYSPVTVNVPASEPNPSKIWRGSVSQYDALSTIEDDRVYIITNSTNCPYMKIGSVSVTPPSEPGYEAVILDYTSPSDGSFSDYIIPIAQINKYPEKGWQLEFNVNATNRERDNVICGTGSGGTGLREVYIKQDGTFWLYDYDSFGDNQVYSGSITNKDVIIRRAIGSGSFEVIVDGNTVYTGTISNHSNGYTLAVGNYNSNYNFTGTINYLKFKWLE